MKNDSFKQSYARQPRMHSGAVSGCLAAFLMMNGCSAGKLQSSRYLNNQSVENGSAIVTPGQNTATGQTQNTAPSLPKSISLEVGDQVASLNLSLKTEGKKFSFLQHESSLGIHNDNLEEKEFRLLQRKDQRSGEWQSVTKTDSKEELVRTSTKSFWKIDRTKGKISFTKESSSDSKFITETSIQFENIADLQTYFASEKYFVFRAQEKIFCLQRLSGANKILGFPLVLPENTSRPIGIVNAPPHHLWLFYNDIAHQYFFDSDKQRIEAQSTAVSSEFLKLPEVFFGANGVLTNGTLKLSETIAVSSSGVVVYLGDELPKIAEPSDPASPDPGASTDQGQVVFTEEFWNTSVKTVALKYCANCHLEGASIPWQKADRFDGWKEYADQIISRLQAKTMPPASPTEASKPSDADLKLLLDFATQSKK